MKRLFATLLLLLGIGSTCFGMCSSWEIDVWPSAGKVLPNQEFMFEGYEMARAVAYSLCKRHPAYLYSDSGRVELEVVDIHDGQFRLTQAIFRPEKQLQPGLTYRLVYHNKVRWDTLMDYDYSKDALVPVEWTVQGEPDHVADPFLTAPTVLRKEFTYFGCGPSRNVIFGISTQSQGLLRVKARVRKVGSLRWTTYLLPVYNQEVEVGHGMCSGAFVFKNGEAYEAVLDLVDAAGNVSRWKGGPIRFNAPTPKDSPTYG